MKEKKLKIYTRKLTPEGRITLPIKFREILGLGNKTKVEICLLDDGILVKKK